MISFESDYVQGAHPEILPAGFDHPFSLIKYVINRKPQPSCSVSFHLSVHSLSETEKNVPAVQPASRSVPALQETDPCV